MKEKAGTKKNYRLEISGLVQGVGFRPFVSQLANEMSLAGYCLNRLNGVEIALRVSPSELRQFVTRLKKNVPGQIAGIEIFEAEYQEYSGFGIEKSRLASSGALSVFPDTTICPLCRHEMLSGSQNQRYYHYAFTSCSHCGPRFSLLKDVPFDRPLTSMSEFELCPACQQEYQDPGSRRFHSQTQSCRHCGPALLLYDEQGQRLQLASDYEYAAFLCQKLRQGKIAAVKGIGGIHLVCDARNEEAVQKLRLRKQRPRQALALMFADLVSIKKHARVSKSDEKLLQSAARPIVLVRKKKSDLAPSVSPGLAWLGAMLPASGLHELLLEIFQTPLVMTSANVSGLPILSDNQLALEKLSGIADFFLLHNRSIVSRCDDSVLFTFKKKTVFVRRSRGYVPLPLALGRPMLAPVLAAGAENKNVFCLASQKQALLSQHIGDMKNFSTLQFFSEAVSHFCQLLRLQPAAVAVDPHGAYQVSSWARQMFAKEQVIEVWHHHAHIVSCLADNDCSEVVMGLALDGTGLGPDGSWWGGELLIADRRDFFRAGSLRPFRLPGGEKAVAEPWRVALSLCHEAGLGLAEVKTLPFSQKVGQTNLEFVWQMLEKNINCLVTSSLGRLFDGVSALLNICRVNSYEGQAAMELESQISSTVPGAYRLAVQPGSPLLLDHRPLVAQIVADLATGKKNPAIALMFHRAIENGFADLVDAVAQKTGLKTVALSGGCFLNRHLSLYLHDILTKRGYIVLYHINVSPSDSGLALGQALVADSVLRGEASCVWQFQ